MDDFSTNVSGGQSQPCIQYHVGSMVPPGLYYVPRRFNRGYKQHAVIAVNPAHGAHPQRCRAVAQRYFYLERQILPYALLTHTVPYSGLVTIRRVSSLSRGAAQGDVLSRCHSRILVNSTRRAVTP